MRSEFEEKGRECLHCSCRQSLHTVAKSTSHSVMSNSLSGNGDLDLNTSLDVDDDLLDDLSRGVQVDQTLVDSAQCQHYVLSTTDTEHLMCIPHLVQIPGLGALTARRLAGRDLQVLGGHADRALDTQLLALRTVNQLLADLLQGSDLAAGQGNADLVDLGLVELRRLLGVLERHRCGCL